MIEVFAAGNAGLMTGLRDRLVQGGAARARLYGGARGSVGPLVALVLLADVAGTVDGTTGNLLLSTGPESVLILGTAPTWGVLCDGADVPLFALDARLSTDADTGQELVLSAPDGVYAGALLSLSGGTLTALPAEA